MRRHWTWLVLAMGWLGGAAGAQTLHPLTSIPPPAWIKRPSADQMTAAFPRKARDARVGGWVVIECQTEATGDLKACQVLGEAPVDHGFGQAGLSLSRYFRLDAAKLDPAELAGGVVTIPIVLFMNAAPLTNTLAGSPALLLTPDTKGSTACPTDDAPKRTCVARRFYWAARPNLVETAPFVRAAAAEPAITSVLCSVAVDMKVTACSQAGPADPSQVKAMNSLLPRFTIPEQADDKTPTRGGLIYVQFDWPALKHAVETSVLTKPGP